MAYNNQAGPFWDFVRSMSEQYNTPNTQGQGEGVDRAPNAEHFNPFTSWGPPPPPHPPHSPHPPPPPQQGEAPHHGGPPGPPPHPDMNPMESFNPWAFAFGPQGWAGNDGRHGWGGPRGRHGRHRHDEEAFGDFFGPGGPSGEGRHRGPPPFGGRGGRHGPPGRPFDHEHSGRHGRGHSHGRRSRSRSRSHSGSRSRSFSPNDERTLINEIENMNIGQQNDKDGDHSGPDTQRSGKGPDGPKSHKHGKGKHGRGGPRGGRHGSRSRSRGPHRGPSPNGPHHHGPGPHRGPHRGRGGFRGFPFGGPGPRGGYHPRGPPGRMGMGGFDFGSMLAGLANHPMAQAWLPPHIQDHMKGATRGTDTVDKEENADGTFTPPVDLFSTEGAYILHVAVPGAKKEDVGVNWDAEGNSLSIAGVVHRPGDEAFLQSLTNAERRVGMFERNIKLLEDGVEVDGDAISAKLEDGVLVITVPKVEKEWTDVKKVDIN